MLFNLRLLMVVPVPLVVLGLLKSTSGANFDITLCDKGQHFRPNLEEQQPLVQQSLQFHYEKGGKNFIFLPYFPLSMLTTWYHRRHFVSLQFLQIWCSCCFVNSRHIDFTFFPNYEIVLSNVLFTVSIWTFRLQFKYCKHFEAKFWSR